MPPLASRNLPERAKERPPHPDVVPALAVSAFLMDWHLSHPEQQDEYMAWLRDEAAKRRQMRADAPQADSGAVVVHPLHLAFASPENTKWWIEHYAALMEQPVQGCALPPKAPKPPKLEIVKGKTYLAPMVLDRASLSTWGKAFYTAHNAHPGSIELKRLIDKGTPIQQSAIERKAAA